MDMYTSTPRSSSRARNPHNGRRQLNTFAQAAVFAEFRARDAKAILDVNFIDRRPVRSSPDTGSAQNHSAPST